MALTANRSAPQLDPVKGFRSEWTVIDADIIYSGSLVARDYADEIQPAADTEGLQVVGVRKASGEVDNTDDGETAAISTGVYLFDNSSTYAVPLSSIGLPCYVEDDETVAGYSTNMVAAGIVRDVTDDGVYVDTSVNALTLARELTPPKRTAVTDNKTVTAAECFARRNFYPTTDGDGNTAVTLTLPAAVGGMRFGASRSDATGGNDVTIQCDGTDVIEGSDGYCDEGNAVTNDTDAVTDVVWWECITDGRWQLARPFPYESDLAAWAKDNG